MKLKNVNNLRNEIWKKVKYKNLKSYYISNMGRIYSIKRRQLIKGITNGDNHYLRVHLYNEDGTYENIAVHRIVAFTFIENDDLRKNEVNHINGNQMDNRVINLEWVTKSQNMIHVMNENLKSKNVRICMLDSKLLKILKIFKTKIAIKNRLTLNTIYRNINLDNLKLNNLENEYYGFKWAELNYLKEKYPDLIDDFNNDLPKDLMKIEKKSKAIKNKFKIVCLVRKKDNSIFYIFMNIFYALKEFKLNKSNLDLTLDNLPKIKGYYWKYLDKNNSVDIIEISYIKNRRDKINKMVKEFNNVKN